MSDATGSFIVYAGIVGGILIIGSVVAVAAVWLADTRSIIKRGDSDE